MKDNIKDIFESALRNQELPVRPDLWSGVQAGITQSAVGAASSSALLAKIIGGGLAASLIVVGSVYLFNGSSSVSNKSAQSTETKKDEAVNNPKVPIVDGVAGQDGSTAANNTTMANVEQQNSVFEQAEESIVAPNLREAVIKATEKDQVKLVEEKKQYTTIVDRIEPTNPVAINPSTSTGKSVVIGELPNIFTPNGDGQNDVLKFNIQNVKEFQVTIMDQNNKTVFTSSDSNFEWSGLDLSGNMVAPGEYIYFMIGKGNDNVEFKEFKRLTIK